MKLINIKEKLKNSIFSKEKYTLAKVIIAIIISIAVATVMVVIKPVKIWDRLPIFAFIICFGLMHFIFKIKDIYEFIYKKRYILAALFMTYVVIMGYSGSSIATYREVIQGEYQEQEFMPILGYYRSIRSDEWNVNTPIYTSQAVDKENPYSYFNDNLRGTKTDMSSIGNAPILDISIIGKPLNIGYIILGPERGLSFIWYGKLTLLVLMSFEFCMMITNKNKLISLLGMFLITFSDATQWWYATEYFIWGMMVLVLFNKFLQTQNIKMKLLCALGIFVAGLSYIFIFYPAWQLSFGYIYLAIFIWICIKNRKEYKKYKRKWLDAFIIIIVLVTIGLMVGRYIIKSNEALKLTLSTDYPGERFEIGGGTEAPKIVFSYVYSYLFPYMEVNNPCEYAGMISYFPIPMLIALMCIAKNIKNKDKKNLAFLIPLIIVSIVFTVWTFISTNHLFAKITFLYMVPATRMAVPLGVTQVLLLIYILGNVEIDIIKNKKISLIIAFALNIFIVLMARRTDKNLIMDGMKLYICGLINLVAIYLMINYNTKRNKYLLVGLLITISIIAGAMVNPIQKGIKVLNGKPISKEIQKIVSEDSENNLWIAEYTTFYVPNYILANGGKVINSTNIYPNFELYKTVLGEDAEKEEIRKIYNRYAHLNIEVSNENKLELLYEDSIKLYITTEKLKELSVKYIVSVRDNLNEFDSDNISYEQIYGEYGMYIYKLKY